VGSLPVESGTSRGVVSPYRVAEVEPAQLSAYGAEAPFSVVILVVMIAVLIVLMCRPSPYERGVDGEGAFRLFPYGMAAYNRD
jgi:hypothetical protein